MPEAFNGQLAPELLRYLRSAQRVAVLTGAGVSAESGVPTFRDAMTGLWSHYRPEDLASPEAFAQNPALVWDWYAWRRGLTEAAAPNPGHYALAALEQRFPTFTLLTQNVDSLHQRAGSQNVVELHGNISLARCSNPACPASRTPAPIEAERSCTICSAPLRPNVVWFGEALPKDALSMAIQAAETCDILFSIGTSSMVYPAAQLPDLALSRGAVVVEINPDQTPLTAEATYALHAPSGVVLPALLAALQV